MAADSEPSDNPTVPRLFVGQIGRGLRAEYERYPHPLGIVRGARVLRPQQSGQSGTFPSHMAAYAIEHLRKSPADETSVERPSRARLHKISICNMQPESNFLFVLIRL